MVIWDEAIVFPSKNTPKDEAVSQFKIIAVASASPARKTERERGERVTTMAITLCVESGKQTRRVVHGFGR